ncbi:NAD-dependent epimerase/dehydratase family protein [Antarctobacter sp.]|uniref:NAD-dependent epimerase/dehydratase family protein n=1 Tax=Antarctobacter sp. TaxID=1872577 RepID=UPI003A8FD2CF
MSVLVIGGTGFIGRRVVRAFAAEGHQVVSADVELTDLFDRHGIEATAIRLDISDFAAVRAAMERYAPKIVINLAYMRETTPHAAMKVNVLGMDNCLEAARLTGVDHVVFASSIAVNGRQAQYGDRAICEDDPPYPTYQYAVHKVFNEWQAREYREKHGLTVTSIRVGHAAAPGKLVGAVDHVQCITGPATGAAVRFPFEDKRRCVIHVDDVAEIFRRVALKRCPDHSVYYTGGQTLSLGEIAEMVRERIPDADITFDAPTGGDAHSIAYRFDNRRLCEEFAFSLPDYRHRIAGLIEVARSKAPF